jgi:hypothetical protein
VTYTTLLEVLLKHLFYTNRRCPDFAIEPDVQTARLLRGHRCLLRTRPDGFSIVTPLDDAGLPFLPLPAGATLRFLLRLRNGDFALFTDLSAIEKIVGEGKWPVFANEGETDELQPVPEDPPNGEPAFAGIRIVLPVVAATLWAGFLAKQARWAYYCVTDHDKQLRIVDDRLKDPIFFVGGEPGPGDPIAAQLKDIYPGRRPVRFLSQATVLCSEAPRKTLKLLLGEDVLLHPLPNPSPRSFTQEDVPPPQYRLFQIIEYDTNPTLSPG